MPMWIPAVLVGLVLVAVVLARVFGGGDKGRPELVEEAETEISDIKAVADAQLQAELVEVAAAKAELLKITMIDDDAARLEALAKYANRGRKG